MLYWQFIILISFLFSFLNRHISALFKIQKINSKMYVVSSPPLEPTSQACSSYLLRYMIDFLCKQLIVSFFLLCCLYYTCCILNGLGFLHLLYPEENCISIYKRVFLKRTWCLNICMYDNLFNQFLFIGIIFSILFCYI